MGMEPGHPLMELDPHYPVASEEMRRELLEAKTVLEAEEPDRVPETA